MTRFRGTWALPTAFAFAAAAGSYLAAQPDADAANRDKRMYPMNAKVFGKKVKDWIPDWQQWGYSIPQAASPLLDTTGEFAEVGQRGPVWFLCGVFAASGTATRNVAIPAGKALFFPIIDVQDDDIGVVPPRTSPEMYVHAAGIIGALAPGSLHVELDGSEMAGIDKTHLVSSTFKYWVPDLNVNQWSGLDSPRGIYSPALCDGYWVMLKPLAPGPHSLRFRGTFGPPVNFGLDITYNLTVVDHSLP